MLARGGEMAPRVVVKENRYRDLRMKQTPKFQAKTARPILGVCVIFFLSFSELVVFCACGVGFD